MSFSHFHVAALAAAALAAACFAPRTYADEWNKKTVVNISGPIEIPGRVLPAGTYVFKLLDSQSDRDILEIYDKNEQHLVTTVMAVPDYRMRTPGHPILKFEERASNAPEALKSFFYPGDNFGLQFVYPHDQAVALARRTNSNVLSMDNGTGPSDMKHAHISGVNGQGQSVEMNGMVQSSPNSSNR
jgi:hypothetical protein